MDITHGERAEASLDTLIERRHERRIKDEGQRQLEELWMPSERAYAARRSRELAEEWYFYRLDQAERAERNGVVIAAGHRAEAARILRDELGGKLESENGHHKEESA